LHRVARAEHGSAARQRLQDGRPGTRHLCRRQIQPYLRLRRPLTAEEGWLMLGPVLNLARLDLRAGSGDDALRRLEDADQTVAAGRYLAVDGSVLPVSAIGGTSVEHAKLRNVVRALHVGDGVRASTASRSAPPERHSV
jgi:hypothetical protein